MPTDLPSDGACIVPGPTILGRARDMVPMIFLAVSKGGIMTTTVRGGILITDHQCKESFSNESKELISSGVP